MSIDDHLTDVTVKVGFGVNAIGGNYFVLNDTTRGELDDTTYLLAPDTVFVDVTEHVAAMTTGRGRERELDEYTTGTATVVFNDDDRTFDPAYTGSPYAGEIVPMKRINIDWRDIRLYTGWIDDWAVTYEPGDNLSRVTAICVDGFGILANNELSEIAAAHAGDTSGARIRRVLGRGEVAYPASQAIDDGVSVLAATTLGENTLSYLQQCARAEAGYLFVTADGTLTFLNRLSTLNTSANVTFSDDSTAGIPYRTILQRSAADLLYTRVTASAGTTGNEIVATDAGAADDFLIRTLPMGSVFIATDADTQQLVDYYLERFSIVEQRFQAATINMVALTAGQLRQVLRLDLTDVVNVQRSPLGVGDTIERLSLIDGISHSIGHASWTVDVAFSNSETRSFLMLDDDTFGTLGANRVAF